MKLRALLFLFLSVGLAAQSNGPQNQANIPVTSTQFTVPLLSNPDPAYNATIGQVGIQGPQVIYYWISANYVVGKASLAGPFVMYTAVGTLSSSNYVTINPVLAPSATSYDVLKTSTPAQPTGNCNCAVATNVAPGTVTADQSNSTSSYTVNPLVPAGLTVTLTNEPQSANVSHLILRQNGAFVCDISVGCGSGSGVTITNVAGLATVPGKTNGTLAVVTDGVSTTDCTVGGSSTNVVCQYNGTSWAPLPSTGTPQAAAPASPLANTSSSTSSVYVQGVNYDLLASTSTNWTHQFTSAAITGCPTGISCATQSITLPAGIVGIDTTGNGEYQIFLCDGTNSNLTACPATSEAVTITGGSYTTASGGTVTFVPFNSHSTFIAMSATQGAQETWNATCGVSATPSNNGQCNVTIPANNYASLAPNTYGFTGILYLHGFQSTLSGYGTTVICLGRNACIQVGNLANANNTPSVTLQGLSFRTPGASLGHFSGYTNSAAYAGVNITNTVTSSGVQTITTATAHGFQPGDMVSIQFTDTSSYWGDCVIATVPTTTTFTCPGSGNISSQATPGVVALDFVAVLDNGNNTHLTDLTYDLVGESGKFNHFFDFWDDENATVEHFNNNGISLNRGATWTGSFFYSGGAAHVSQQLAPVITVRDSSITANFSNCATVLNSNGLHFENTVCQASGLWEIKSSNERGNYQGAEITNIYSENAASDNPVSPVYTPFPGTGVAGAIFGSGTGATRFSIHGGTGMGGAFASGGTGSTPYNYYIVVHDCPIIYNCTSSPNLASVSSPLPILLWESTGSDSIPIRWPRVANGTDVITYDVIRSSGTPSNGNCTGGTGGACGSVATGLSQASACSGTLVCSYTDTGSSTTSNYPYPTNTGNYVGNLHFWPGALVVVGTGSLSTPVDVDNDQSPAVGLGLSYSPIQTAKRCGVAPGVSASGYDVCLATTAASGVPNQTATLLTDGYPGQGMSLSKGRLNILNVGTAVNPHHIITLLDSQPTLTETTGGYRPPASVNDVWIGTDVASGTSLTAGRLAFGAPVSITNYIAQVGDGVTANWLERLSASLKEFNVATQFDQNVVITGLTPGNSPICPNGTGGALVNAGCASGSGTITAVNPGAGITGGGSSGSVTVAIATGGVTDTLGSFANKPSAGLVATSNITLSGAQTIDGVAGTAGTTIVLCTAQTTASQNGPWIMQTGAWTRPTWYPSGGTTQAFQFIIEKVRLGTTYGGSEWKMTTSGTVTIDTTATTWTIDPITLNSSTVAGLLPSTLGGTGVASPTAHAVAIGEGSSAMNFAVAASAGLCLLSNSSADPSFQSCPGLTNPMTTLGDSVVGGSSGSATRLAGPTSPNGVTQVYTSTPSGGVAAQQAWALPGVPGRAVTGTTNNDTILATDCAPARVEYEGSVAVAVTLPTATTLAVPHCVFRLVNETTGSLTALTVTPTTWTCNGAATCTIAQGQIATFYVDPNSSTNWVADIVEQTVSAGQNVAVARSPTGVSITAHTGLPLFASYTFFIGDGSEADCTSGNVCARSNANGTVTYQNADAAVVINDVLTAYAASGGLLHFNLPHTTTGYPLNSFTAETATGCSSFTPDSKPLEWAIGIPYNAWPADVQWTFEGEAAPVAEGESTTTTVNTNGVIFNITSSAISGATSGAFLAGLFQRPVSSSCTLNYNNTANNIRVKNIDIRFPGNQRGNECAFCLWFAQSVGYDEDIADFNVGWGSLASGSAPVQGSYGAFGFTSSTSGAANWQNFRNTWSAGYYINYDWESELITVDHANAIYGVWAAEIGRAATQVYHPILIKYFTDQENQNGILFGPQMQAGTRVDIQGYDLELGSSNWYSTRTAGNFSETNPCYTRGQISYNVVLQGTGIIPVNPASWFSSGGQCFTYPDFALYQPFQDYDLFQGTSGTALNSHTSNLSHTWAAWASQTGGGAGTLTLNGTGGVTATSSAGNAYVASLNSTTPNSANYKITATFTDLLSATFRAGLYGRATSGTTGYGFVCGWAIGTAGGCALYNATVQIGTTYQLVQGWPVGVTHSMSLSMNGSTIIGYLDGIAIITATDSTITTVGQAGIQLYNNAGAMLPSMTMTNFMVQ